MIPAAPQMLLSLAGALGGRILPALDPDNYAAGDTRTIALMLVLLAQDADRAADRLVRENGEMRDILGDEAVVPGDFRIAALQAEHDRLTALLIALHASVEDAEDEGSRSTERRIWAYLRTAAENRALVLPETS